MGPENLFIIIFVSVWSELLAILKVLFSDAKVRPKLLPVILQQTSLFAVFQPKKSTVHVGSLLTVYFFKIGHRPFAPIREELRSVLIPFTANLIRNFVPGFIAHPQKTINAYLLSLSHSFSSMKQAEAKFEMDFVVSLKLKPV